MLADALVQLKLSIGSQFNFSRKNLRTEYAYPFFLAAQTPPRFPFSLIELEGSPYREKKSDLELAQPSSCCS
jgi:hypothetical protein